jgi:TPR repeat protein
MAADQNHCKAQRDYGRCLLLGLGMTADFSSAIDFYIKSMKNGDIQSRIIIAVYFCCNLLDSVESDDEFEWIERDFDSLNAGSSPNWMIECEKMMQNGEGESDIIYALQTLRVKADEGNRTAQLLSGLCLRSRKEGIEYLKRSVDQNEPRAAEALLNIYRDEYWKIQLGLFDICVSCLKIACWVNEPISSHAMEVFAIILTRASVVRKWLITNRKGNVNANVITSRFVVSKFGRHSEFHDSSWSTLLRKYRELIGNRDGLQKWMNGWCYEHGIDCELNLSSAANCYRQSAESGFVLGQYHYSLFLCHGLGVKRNLCEAVSELRDAAQQGNVEAMFEYGVCLDFGITIETNIVEAIKYYQKASPHHHISALKAIGDCLMTGRGVEVNQSLAREYLSLAHELSKAQGSSDLEWERWMKE